MKRTALLVLLLVAYAGMFGRRLVTSTTEMDPVGPQAREIERALADKQYERALPLAKELQSLHPHEPLIELWMTLIYEGLHRGDEEKKAWERFIEFGSAPEEACPGMAFARSPADQTPPDFEAFERCARLDPRDPQRLIDFADALRGSGKPDEALAVYRRAADMDPRNPLIVQRIERLSQWLAGRPR
jgi:tetratricopeptide (TPR) repeat protein